MKKKFTYKNYFFCFVKMKIVFLHYELNVLKQMIHSWRNLRQSWLICQIESFLPMAPVDEHDQ